MLEAEHALRIQGVCCPVHTYLKASFELLFCVTNIFGIVILFYVQTNI